MRSWEMTIILKEHILYMRHRQTLYNHSTLIVNAWTFGEIQISIKSCLVVSSPLDSWGHYIQILAQWECALLAEPWRTSWSWWSYSPSNPSRVRLQWQRSSSSSMCWALGDRLCPFVISFKISRNESPGLSHKSRRNRASSPRQYSKHVVDGHSDEAM